MMMMQKDPGFFELCEDYEIPMKATEYWSGKGVPGAQDKAKEFRSMATDLEVEIALKLAGFTP